jgi:hypothetical protein
MEKPDLVFGQVISDQDKIAGWLGLLFPAATIYMFAKGWHHDGSMAILVYVIALLSVVLIISFAYIKSIRYRISESGIEKRSWRGKNFVPWNVIRMALVYRDKHSTRIFVSSTVITKPADGGAQPTHYLSMPHAWEILERIHDHGIKVIEREKGFDITDLKDIADLFR